MKCKVLFSGKTNNNIIIYRPEFAQRVVKVKYPTKNVRISSSTYLEFSSVCMHVCLYLLKICILFMP